MLDAKQHPPAKAQPATGPTPRTSRRPADPPAALAPRLRRQIALDAWGAEGVPPAAGGVRAQYVATAPVDPPAAPRAPTAAPYGTVVDDGLPVGEGQVARTAFLDRIAAAVTAAAEEELAKVGRTTADCPYIAHWLAYYRGRSAAEIERAIERYAAPTRVDPDGLVAAISARVKLAVEVWAKTGKLVGFGGPSRLPPPSDEDTARRAGAAAAPQTKPLGEARASGPPDAPTVQRSLGSGRPLDSGVRARIEPAFGRSFADVRVHTDAVAARLATSLTARAFTVGSDVGFGAGQYRPSTLAGDLLIAHELAHVVQQEGGRGGTFLDDGTFAQLEREADEAALAALARRNGHARSGSARGLRLQRCGSDVDFSKLAKAPEYEQVLTRLAELYAQKEDIAAGRGNLDDLDKVNAQIAEQIEQLRILGIQLPEDEIYRRVTATFHPPGEKGMRTVGGTVLREPPGPAYIGERLTFRFVPDYLPPESNVTVEWYFRSTDDKVYGNGPMHGGTNPMTAVPANRGFGVTLAERFWSKGSQRPVVEQIEKAGGLVPIAVVKAGDADPVEIPGDFVPMTSRPPSFEVEVDPPTPIPNSGVKLQIKDWAPVLGRYVVEWKLDGKDLGPGLMIDNAQIGAAGEHWVSGSLYKAKDEYDHLTPAGPLLAFSMKTFQVLEREAIGEKALAQAGALQPPPPLAKLDESIRTSMQEIAKRGVLGGEREAYWQSRYEAQQKRLDKLAEFVPDYKQTKDLPADATQLDESTSYAQAIPAVIVYGPGPGGSQPISIYLTARKSGTTWSARLVDMTGKPHKFDGSGATALAAYQDAFATWRSDNPYPTGGLVVYQFTPAGWTFPKSFSTTTGWKTAKEWVDSVLEVGGVVIGLLLLVAPDLTVTKVAGLALLGLGVARSGVGIYERLQLGDEPLDKENVVDGIMIVTSLLGFGGGVLRSLGEEARAVGSPLVYRVGNWMVVTTLAADVGTLVYATADALTELRAARGDPTMDDAQRAQLVLGVVSRLLFQGILLFASNRELFREGLTRSDFVKTRLPEKETVSLSKGMRLDVELELRKAGADPKAVRAMDERTLLSNFLVLQRRQAAGGRIESLRAKLTPGAQAELDAARLQQPSTEAFAGELEQLPDPKKHFEDLAAQRQKAVAGGAPTAADAVAEVYRKAVFDQLSPEAQKRFPKPEVVQVDAAEMQKRTGSSLATAAIEFEGDRARIVVKRGTPPGALVEEAAHLEQLLDPRLRRFAGMLDQGTLKKWSTLDPKRRAQLWGAKLELEIDAQRRVLAALRERIPKAPADEAEELRFSVEDAWQNLEALRSRYAELSGYQRTLKGAARTAVAEPEFLGEAPRLLNKATAPDFALDDAWLKLTDPDAFVAQYKARYPNTTLSEPELKQRFADGQRLHPGTGRLRGPDAAVVAREAQYTGPATTYSTDPAAPAGTRIEVDQPTRARADEIRAKREAALKRRRAAEETAGPTAEADRAAAQYDVISASREYGELWGEAWVRSKYGAGNVDPVYQNPVSRSGDFDMVFKIRRPGGAPNEWVIEYIVIEAKGGSSPLGSRMAGPIRVEQGTPEYFQSIIEAMAASKSKKAQDAAAELRAAPAGTIHYVHVKVPVEPGSIVSSVVTREFALTPPAPASP